MNSALKEKEILPFAVRKVGMDWKGSWEAFYKRNHWSQIF